MRGHRVLLVLLLVITVATLAQAVPQTITEVRKLYESGQDQRVIQLVTASRTQGTARAPLSFEAAHSYERLKQSTQAKQLYTQIATLPTSDPWKYIGQSGVAIIDRNYDSAVSNATRATSLGPNLAQAHYQLGMAYAYKQDHTRAAPAFAKATTLDATYAYANYYAGMSYYRIRRFDLMTRHFEVFVRLAPSAPERAQVESILRTIRG